MADSLNYPNKIIIFKGSSYSVKEEFNEFSRKFEGTIHQIDTCGTPDNMALTVLYTEKMNYRYF